MLISDMNCGISFVTCYDALRFYKYSPSSVVDSRQAYFDQMLNKIACKKIGQAKYTLDLVVRLNGVLGSAEDFIEGRREFLE